MPSLANIEAFDGAAIAFLRDDKPEGHFFFDGFGHCLGHGGGGFANRDDSDSLDSVEGNRASTRTNGATGDLQSSFDSLTGMRSIQRLLVYGDQVIRERRTGHWRSSIVKSETQRKSKALLWPTTLRFGSD